MTLIFLVVLCTILALEASRVDTLNKDVVRENSTSSENQVVDGLKHDINGASVSAEAEAAHREGRTLFGPFGLFERLRAQRERIHNRFYNNNNNSQPPIIINNNNNNNNNAQANAMG